MDAVDGFSEVATHEFFASGPSELVLVSVCVEVYCGGCGDLYGVVFEWDEETASSDAGSASFDGVHLAVLEVEDGVDCSCVGECFGLVVVANECHVHASGCGVVLVMAAMCAAGK